MTIAEPPAPGLQRAGARLPIDEYTKRLWQRRHFVTAYASASNAVGYQRTFLGQAWQVLTPMLNILVFYLVFGLLLHTNRGVSNYIAFLSTGVFVFAFCTTSLVSGSTAVTGNLGLVRALPFPRAVLPISTTLRALLQLVNSLIVLVPILLLSGEPVTWRWVLLVPSIALQALFCLGLAFVVARIGARIPDTKQVLPFIARVWLYLSGVMYSVQVFGRGHPGWVSTVLNLNPANIYLSLARSAVLVGSRVTAFTWLLALAWAVGTVSVSYLYFWRGEEVYGNV